MGVCEDEPAALPFGAGVGVAATDPKEDTAAAFIVGTAAGEEEMGAEASLMEPNVTAFAAGTLSVLPRDSEYGHTHLASWCSSGCVRHP